MSQFHRAGKPFHKNSATGAATLQKWPLPGQSTQIMFHNIHATESIELFLTEEDAVKGAGYGFPVAAGYGVNLDVGIGAFWTISTNASSFVFLAACRG